MAFNGVANVIINSDWATFQLVTDGANAMPLPGAPLPPGTVFTPNGFVFGQPNQQLVPQNVAIQVLITADVPVITFITGKGDGGTGGPQAGFINVELGNGVYPNNNITGDGLNIQGFFNAALQ